MAMLNNQMVDEFLEKITGNLSWMAMPWSADVSLEPAQWVFSPKKTWDYADCWVWFVGLWTYELYGISIKNPSLPSYNST